MRLNPNTEIDLNNVAQSIKNGFKRLAAYIKKIDENSSKKMSYKGRIFKLNAARLTLAVVVLAVAFALIFNLVVMPRLNPNRNFDLDLDAGSGYTQTSLGSNILLLNNNGMKAVDKEGETKWEYETTLTAPVVDVEDGKILLADLDGNCTMRLFDENGELKLTYPIGSGLSAAELNKNGYAVAVVDESGYKGSVVVYDKRGEEVFKWNSGEGYIIDAALSDNNKYVAVSQMMSDSETVYSRIIVLSVDDGSVISTSTRNDSLVSDIRFYGNSSVIGVSDSDVCCYTRDGELRYEISFAGKKPTLYNIDDSDSLFAVLCQDSRGNSNIEIYSSAGKFLGSYTSASEIKDMIISGGKIIASTSRTVVEINRRGKLKNSVDSSHDIKTIGLYGNNRNVLIIGGNKADIISI